MTGPFTTYAPPGVFTRTLTEAPKGTISGDLRLPVLFATGQEVKKIVDQEMVRGSSAIADTLVKDEDISYQFNGLNADFVLPHLPVVKPNGLGQVTSNPVDIAIVVDNYPVAAIQFDGLTGAGVLSSIPRSDSVVKATYFYNRTDRLITKEDVSYQATGLVKELKVKFTPVVDGTDAGTITTDPAKVKAYVNNSQVVVSVVDGANGLITLLNAPVSGDKVEVTYYTNDYQDTSDPLPVKSVSQMVRVGRAPGRADFIEGLDYVVEETLEGPTLQWGASYAIKNLYTSVGTEPAASSLLGLLVDNRRYAEQLSGVLDGVNKVFNCEAFPTDGTGRDRVTDDVTKVIAYVGSNLQAALLAGPVQVRGVFGAERKIELMVAPSVGEIVYLTYWYNMLTDDTFTVEVTTVGGPGVGEYVLTSQNNGFVAVATVTDTTGVTDPDIVTEGVTFPGVLPDLQALPGVSVDEVISVTFPTGGFAYIVSSTNPQGSGGTGQLDQTYIDASTGLRFTIMKGVMVTYAAGDVIQMTVVTNPSLVAGPVPTIAITGLRLTVADLTGTAVTNTATVNTYDKSGEEPAIGDLYYVTLDYDKEVLPTDIYTNIGDVIDEFGEADTASPMSLASSLMFDQGTIAIVCCQIPKGPDGQNATVAAYKDGINSLRDPLPGGYRPAVYLPIRAPMEVFSYAAVNAETQSTIRYKNEHTVIGGYPLGTLPLDAQEFAKGVNSERLTMLYPDGVVIKTVDSLGNELESVVDGTYLAAGYAGMSLSAAVDVATPLTSKQIVSFVRLGRRLDEVTMNQLASSGVTLIVEAAAGLLEVRHSLTTNMSNILTQTPTVITIKDFVQQITRKNLKQFIGKKFVQKMISDVKITMTGIFEGLVNAELITSFGGISVKRSDLDPTIMEVQASYIPIFPLLYITVTFSIRVQ